MPRILSTVDGTHSTITRPVVLGVMREYIALANIDKDSILIYNGQSTHALASGSELNAKDTDNNFSDRTVIELNAVESPLEDPMLVNYIGTQQHTPIFNDPESDIVVRPNYTHTKVEVSVEIKFKNRMVATQFKNEVYRIRNMGRVENLHNIQYSWLISDVIADALYEMHGYYYLLEDNTKNLSEWMKSYASPKIQTLLSLDGKTKRLGIVELQTAVVGWVDFTTPPVMSKDKMDVYTTSFTYTFGYDKLTGQEMVYPLIIQNTLVNRNYRFINNKPKINPNVQLSRTQRALNPVHQNVAFGTAHIPSFDDWLPEQSDVVPGTTAIIAGLIQVDVFTPHAVLDLLSLGKVKLSNAVLAYIYEKPESILGSTESLINFSMYENERLMSPHGFTISNDLDITSKGELNPHKRYRFRISICNDISYLTHTALSQVSRFPDVLYDVLNMTNPDASVYMQTLPIRDAWTTTDSMLTISKLTPTEKTNLQYAIAQELQWVIPGTINTTYSVTSEARIRIKEKAAEVLGITVDVVDAYISEIDIPARIALLDKINAHSELPEFATPPDVPVVAVTTKKQIGMKSLGKLVSRVIDFTNTKGNRTNLDPQTVNLITIIT